MQAGIYAKFYTSQLERHVAHGSGVAHTHTATHAVICAEKTGTPLTFLLKDYSYFGLGVLNPAEGRACGCYNFISYWTVSEFPLISPSSSQYRYRNQDTSGVYSYVLPTNNKTKNQNFASRNRMLDVFLSSLNEYLFDWIVTMGSSLIHEHTGSG